MTFEDNNVDVIFRCHSLEHARDYKKTVKEFTRVAKNDSIFLIEVPVNYETKGADLWDFKSLQDLKKVFQPYIGKILFEESLGKDAKNNFGTTDIIRLIFRIKKRINGF
ncbi:methyltransferase domain-containing protein [Candidatus Borrarchaeum sp.]|uniref:methyltransferase domain-containing protein n=1 Tax=Candidatus Borrarchaeum sp. TaxID=2846742 RepID=UPI00257C72FF|nr:methyltransferase domain-containing protein [Candidatus Borrarchaeum sp.]